MSEFVRVGKVKDAHGIRGELFVILFSGEAAWLEKLESVRLVRESGELGGEFSLKSARPHKNGLIIKSDDIKDRNKAETLKGLLFEIPQSFLVSKPGESIYLTEIKDFTLVDATLGEVGKIVAFSSNTAQDLLVVKTPKGLTYEVPFVKQLVTGIDYEAGIVETDLPPGLIGDDSEADEE